MLLERFLREDLRKRRPGLALLDVWMYCEWRLYDWRRFLVGRR
jgi:hypothetical protein